jgi:hypothetical protein
MRQTSDPPQILRISRIGDLVDRVDPFAPARGVINGTMMGLGFWAVIVWALL